MYKVMTGGDVLNEIQSNLPNLFFVYQELDIVRVDQAPYNVVP